jgi:hypothetical protein
VVLPSAIKRRIARSLVTFFALTFIQTVVAPVVAPTIVAPRSEAVTVDYASATSGTEVVVPVGVYSVRLTARGAAGGQGGNDGSALGLAGSRVGTVEGTFAVKPGDRISLYPGNIGGNGVSGLSSAAGGSAGGASIYNYSGRTPSFKLSGSFSDAITLAGGAGGAAGSGGSSGGGGGGGAGTLIAINENVALVAGGAGGGGGGSGGVATAWDEVFVSSGSSTGGTGIGGGTCGSADGGGSGGGGGGWMGGAAGAVTRPAGGECRGYGGSAGGNYVDSNATSVVNGLTTANGAGSVTYVFTYDSLTSCTTDVQTVDIYTIVKVTRSSSCTWTVPSTVNVVDLFLIGGGAGGAGDAGGGGGGGAALSRTAIPVTPNTNLTLKVGYGGSGNAWGYIGSAYAGDSTTVVTSTGTLYSALGGSVGVQGPGGAGGLGGVASNGGFSGGQGGTGGICSAANTAPAGGAGKTGISNYYYGSLNTYGGGGGGGSCPNGITNSAALGANGGGNGAYAPTSTTNEMGTNATENSGSGGGGGAASGPGKKLPGGKGGSGIILIRYATDSANEFPSNLASALAMRYSPGDLQLLDSSRKGWIDSSGTKASVANSNFVGAPVITTRGTTDGVNSTDSSKTLRIVKGGISDRVTLSDLPANYTLFHIARYVTGGTTQRIIASSTGNWLSGFWANRNGAAHHNYWLTSSGGNTTNLYGWTLSTDQLKYFRTNGEDVTLNRDANNNGTNYVASQSISNTLALNNDAYGEYSDFEFADLLAFNRELSPYEIVQVETYLARVNGLTLRDAAGSNETDTAFSFNSQYYFGQYASGMFINDTFTVEGWVNPASQCTTSYCSIFSYEEVLLIKIDGGTLQYTAKGAISNYNWIWIDTGVKIPTNEWHHFALVKRLQGNVSNAIELYLDGKLAWVNTRSPYYPNYDATGNTSDKIKTYDTWYYLGVRTNESANFRGQMDEIKVWKTSRTEAEIASDMHSNDASNPNLQLYYDFNQNTLSNTNKLRNLAMGGPSRSDMVPSGTMSYVDVKKVTTNQAYTTVTFPRTYITQGGGWKVPTNIPMSTVIAVAGGGGGGYGGATNTLPAGAGGGGGVTLLNPQPFTVGSVIAVRIGQGGIGGYKADAASVRNGQSTYIGISGGVTVLGGGGGADNAGVGAGGSAVATGGGGGGNTSASCSGTTPSGTIYAGGTVTSGYNGTNGVWGWGGAGGGARGAATAGACGGIQEGLPGPGYTDLITSTEYGRGGSSDRYSDAVAIPGYTTPNNGWGGITSYDNGNTNGRGYNGSAGTVVVRWITASKPAFTPPTNAYLNVGMTETFTTNVASDSSTALLTRTFRWESTTAGSGGTYSPIKIGTGAANAAFSWIPSDTSTSGSQFLYRVVVSDTDTYGLAIVDTSTSVYAVINKTLLMSGTSTIKKTINIARNETFTISQGTPTYRYTLTPTIPGISLDTSTVGTTLLKIADTAAVGTFVETLTVIDSVSASVTIPITIVISAPPVLTNTADVITTGQLFNFDPAVSASYNIATGVASDISGTKKPMTLNGGATYSSDNSGVLSLSTSQYISVTGFDQQQKFAIEAYINLQSISNRTCIFASEAYGYQLCVDSTRTFYGGFYNNSNWTYKRSSQQLEIGAWTHILATFDSTTSGTKMELYLNGAPAPSTDNGQVAGLITVAPYSNKIFINHDYPAANAVAASMLIGFIRFYGRAFTQDDVTQNYNATKTRFAANNLTQIKPTQKYGTLNLESFTVTSGGETETITFAVGNRTGIAWDTASTPGVIKLSVQESLTPGTYYDTITATDNFGTATTLPIAFTVTKADTVTVLVGAATTQVYNKSPAASLPSTTITGLVSSDTGTVVRKFTGVDWTKTCAQGGGCEVGDTGPGGGTIFYISPTAINASTGISTGGTYLEVAPMNWWGSASETTTAWAKAATSVAGTSAAIGSGAENTRLITTALTTNAVAAKIAADLTFGGKSDWFLPSTNEVKEIYDALYITGLAGGFSARNYWSSTQGATTSQADTYWFGSGLVSPTDKLNSYTLRPIRAYSPDTITVTTVPTDVDSYTVTIDTITMTTGSLSYYQNVIFQKSGVEITKARQTPLNVQLYGATYGLPFTLTLQGGSGTGAVSESLTAGSTATGCAVANHIMTATTAGACNVLLKKAASRNYLVETQSASVYFLTWTINQPSPGVGSGSTIALSGQTSVTLDPNAAPTISSLSTYTAQAGVTSIVINGAGFDHNNLAGITVKFWRNQVASGFTVNSGDSQITVTVPAGATTGKVTVTTPNGIAVSELPLTVTP